MMRLRSFKQYIKEFTEHEGYEGNTLFAISPDGKLHTRDTPKGQIREHPDAFPGLNFGRATTWEYDMGMGHAHRERPEPIAHGRINHERKMIQIITTHGGPAAYGDSRILPKGGVGTRKSKKDVEEDSYNRLATLKYLKPYKDYSIYVSHTEAYPVLHSFTEHERYLMELLK